MAKVHLAPLWSIAGGVAGLIAVAAVSPVSTGGWLAALVYLLSSNALLARGLRKSGVTILGAANAVTMVRSTLVALVTAFVVTSFTTAIPHALFIAVASVALALDAVDGWVARRTHTVTALGARFDMEVDAYLILVLSVYVARDLGPWVLIIGALRYAWLVAEWLIPWMRVELRPRHWRKVVAAYTGIALTAAASGLFAPWFSLVAVLVSLGLLLESFGRDMVWLVQRRRSARAAARLSATRD